MGSKLRKNANGLQPASPHAEYGFSLCLRVFVPLCRYVQAHTSLADAMSEFLQQCRDRATRDPKVIVYPEAADPRVLRAVARMVKTRMVKPLLIGSPESIEGRAREIGV